jgi:predicted DCC family thiol-disulfide oxidoreductase YuxK
MESQPLSTILLFDGHCRLCSGLVQFVLKHDRKGSIKMAALQSPEGQELLKDLGLPGDFLNSMLVIKNQKAWFESDAALLLASELGGIWALAGALRWLPAGIRNRAYRLLARYRYRIWGKTEKCFLPDPAWKSRFLDGNYF